MHYASNLAVSNETLAELMLRSNFDKLFLLMVERKSKIGLIFYEFFFRYSSTHFDISFALVFDNFAAF